MASRVKTRQKPKEFNGSRKNALTDRQIIFAERYVNNNCNAKEAALYAGIKESNSSKISSTWLNSDKFPAVQQYIEQLFEKRRNTQEVKGERIIQELARIAFFNQKRLIDKDGAPIAIKDLPEDVVAAISEIHISYQEELDDDGNFTKVKKVRVKTHDKLTALLQLGRMLGLDNGNALTVLNQTNINNIVINWQDLYRQTSAEPRALSPEEDPIERRILSESSGGSPPPAVLASAAPFVPPDVAAIAANAAKAAKKLKVVTNND